MYLLPPPMERNAKNWLFRILCIVIFLCFTAPGAMASQSALETVKTGTDKVLHILRAEAGNKQKGREEIKHTVFKYFDFNEMAKLALGPPWNRQTPAKQQEFAHAFSNFLFDVYINKVEKYTNEKITYTTRPEQDGYAVVDATVTGSRYGRVPLEYYLKRINGEWKVYNVAVEGVDLVSNYRDQFNTILASHSFDDLIRLLKRKTASYG
jgi:phospholipid transport system substrate-binding protein